MGSHAATPPRDDRPQLAHRVRRQLFDRIVPRLAAASRDEQTGQAHRAAPPIAGVLVEHPLHLVERLGGVLTAEVLQGRCGVLLFPRARQPDVALEDQRLQLLPERALAREGVAEGSRVRRPLEVLEKHLLQVLAPASFPRARGRQGPLLRVGGHSEHRGKGGEGEQAQLGKGAAEPAQQQPGAAFRRTCRPLGIGYLAVMEEIAPALKVVHEPERTVAAPRVEPERRAEALPGQDEVFLEAGSRLRLPGLGGLHAACPDRLLQRQLELEVHEQVRDVVLGNVAQGLRIAVRRRRSLFPEEHIADACVRGRIHGAAMAQFHRVRRRGLAHVPSRPTSGLGIEVMLKPQPERGWRTHQPEVTPPFAARSHPQAQPAREGVRHPVRTFRVSPH